MITVVTPRLRRSGTTPLCSEVWSIVTKKVPIATPEPIAMRMPRRLGRTAPRSGTKPTSTTATRASPRAQYPSGANRSPPTRSPQTMGTTAETTAVSGERMLIGPIARHA